MSDPRADDRMKNHVSLMSKALCGADEKNERQNKNKENEDV